MVMKSFLLSRKWLILNLFVAMGYRDESKYSKNAISNVWFNIVNDISDEISLWIINDFRYWHENITKKLLDLVSEHEKVKFSSRRLKRTPSIIHKIKRSINNKTKTKLSNMQDIWWCRCVFDSIADIYDFVAWLEKSKEILSLFKIKYIYDYLSQNTDWKYNTKKIKPIGPKQDGYRWIHIVFESINDNINWWLNIELQLRTKYQHSRATAVEIFDLINEWKIKFWEWEKTPRGFFKRASIAFEKEEWIKRSNYTKSRRLMTDINKEINILKTLNDRVISYDFTRFYQEEIWKKNIQWDMILEIIREGDSKVHVKPYHEKTTNELKDIYLELETKNLKNENIDIVYLSSDEIELAYPNYIWNANFFISTCKKHLLNN